MDRDAELLQRCLEGDRETLREIIQRYEVMVYNLSYQMLHNEEDAKDAAQESFLNLFESLPYFRGECSLKTWLYRIVSSQCIARSRRRGAAEKGRRRRSNSEKFPILALRPLSRWKSRRRTTCCIGLWTNFQRNIV